MLGADGSAGLTWLAFTRADQRRQAAARAWDRFSGPSGATPYRVPWRGPGMTLRSYSVGGTGPVVLINPAPIKSPAIGGLLPEASVIRQCSRAGIRAHAVPWQAPGPSQVRARQFQSFGLGFSTGSPPVRVAMT